MGAGHTSHKFAPVPVHHCGVASGYGIDDATSYDVLLGAQVLNGSTPLAHLGHVETYHYLGTPLGLQHSGNQELGRNRQTLAPNCHQVLTVRTGINLLFFGC
jgi:hypothetical protein